MTDSRGCQDPPQHLSMGLPRYNWHMILDPELVRRIEARNRRLDALCGLRERILREGEKRVSRAPAEAVREDRDR